MEASGLVKQFLHSDPNQRVAAVRASRRLPNEQRNAVLTAVLARDDEPTVRAEVLDDLWRMDAGVGQAAISLAIGDPDSDVRWRALQMIIGMGANGIALLGQVARAGTDAEMRDVAAAHLAELDTAASWSVLDWAQSQRP